MNEREILITKLHSEGMNDSQISASTGIFRQTVGQIRKRLKLKVIPITAIYDKQITILVNMNKNDSEIAKELKISAKTVQYIRKRLNIKTNFVVKKYHNLVDKKKGYLLRNIRFSALQRNLEYSLDIDDFDLPETCPILNIKLDYGGNGINCMNGFSIDRIDNSKGYIKGNIIVMSRLANQMKNKASFEELELFCNNITRLISHYKIQGALGSITDIFTDIKLKT